jgi:transcriptional regulator with XRE-family HTH domain
MGNRAIANLAGRQLSRKLKVLRIRMGLNQIEAADQLEITDKKLSRIENGQMPDVHLFKAMLDLYGLTISEWEPMLDLLRRATEIGWWRAYKLSNSSYVAHEHDACLLRTFQLACIPGLLQTTSYMHEFLMADRTPHSKAWIENVIAVRLRRAERLYSDPVLKLHAVLDENCFRYKFPPVVMRQQLQQVLDRSELVNVTVQVLRDPGPYVGMKGSLAVLSYPDPEELDVAYIEHTADRLLLEDPEEVRECRLDFEHIAKMALSPEESRAYIEQVMARI